MRTVLCCGFVLNALFCAAAPIEIGSHRELFIDSYLVEKFQGDAELFLRDLIALAKERGGNAAKTLGRDELIRMVSLSGGTLETGFEESEIISLVDQLLRCRNPLSCPLGHPTYVEYGRREWKTRFGRRF